MVCENADLWCLVAHTEAGAAGGDDPVDIALITPAEDGGLDADLVVGHDDEVRADLPLKASSALVLTPRSAIPSPYL